jgi:DNA-binding winged helix-turn-helix (wHTH) protein
LRAPASLATLPGRAVAFGPFTFDRASRLLWKNGVEVPLPPRVLGVLALLLDRPGELVTKQELMGAVWRDAFVTETSLAEAVSVLRQTLGDDPQRPTYIQTLHRRGYRFIAEVQEPRAAPVAVAVPGPEPVVAPAPRLSLVVPWVVTLFALLTAAAAVWQYVESGAPPVRRPVRFTLPLPDGLTLSPEGGAAAVSNDGALIAFAACRAADCAIYLRPLSQAEATRVAGTAGGAAPFFSPDGRSLGYFAGGRLNTIAVGGGAPVAIAEAPQPLGATWLGDGRIVFARSAADGLFVASPTRGPVRPFTTPLTGEQGHRWPAVLPDEAGVLFTAAGGSRGDQQYAALASLRTGRWSRLLDGVTAARGPMPGYLLAQRGSDLLAAAFDSRTPAILGVPVVAGPAGAAGPVPHFAISRTGTLAVALPGAPVLHVVLDWSDELRRVVPPPEPALPR